MYMLVNDIFAGIFVLFSGRVGGFSAHVIVSVNDRAYPLRKSVVTIASDLCTVTEIPRTFAYDTCLRNSAASGTR